MHEKTDAQQVLPFEISYSHFPINILVADLYLSQALLSTLNKHVFLSQFSLPLPNIISNLFVSSLASRDTPC